MSNNPYDDAQAEFDLKVSKLEDQGECTAHLVGPDECWCNECQYQRWVERETLIREECGFFGEVA